MNNSTTFNAAIATFLASIILVIAGEGCAGYGVAIGGSDIHRLYNERVVIERTEALRGKK